MALRDDINIPILSVTGVISVLLLAVILIAVQGLFQFEMQREVASKYDAATVESLAALRSQARANLTGYRLVDAERKIVAIPIDEAMKQLVAAGGKLPELPPAPKTD